MPALWCYPEYPAPVITKADNHPVYVNGTVLVNGMPIITDRTKDSSRIEEFKKLGFSREYIQWLTGDFSRYECSRGSPCKNTRDPTIPSYTKIGLTGVLVEPATVKDGIEISPEKVHNYEICANRILIDGYFVCDAPDYHGNGKKFTPAQKVTFCKAVIWQLLHDEGSLIDQISTLGTSEVPRVNRDEVPATFNQNTTITPVKQYPFPVKVQPAGWINHLRLCITEVPA